MKFEHMKPAGQESNHKNNILTRLQTGESYIQKKPPPAILETIGCQREINMSSKIHPAAAEQRSSATHNDHPPLPSVFTVWKRSSISFHGTDGFTVFDHLGRLIFRVDNYTRRRTARLSSSVVVGSGGGGCRRQVYAKEHCRGLVLMDGSGKALLTLTPQLHMPSMQYHWIGYRGEDDECNPRTALFMMRKSSQPSPSLLSLRSIMSPQISCEAEIFIGDYGRHGTKSGQRPDYQIEGSFKRRSCKIVAGADGQTLASISRKLARTTNNEQIMLLSDDVFSLVVEAGGIEPHLVMAFIMVIDRLCPKSYTPFLCS